MLFPPPHLNSGGGNNTMSAARSIPARHDPIRGGGNNTGIAPERSVGNWTRNQPKSKESTSITAFWRFPTGHVWCIAQVLFPPPHLNSGGGNNTVSVTRPTAGAGKVRKFGKGGGG